MIDKTGYLSNEQYRAAYELVPRLCVDLVFCHNDRVLLTKRVEKPYLDHWHVPGGRVRFRESIVDAVNRIGQVELDSAATIQAVLGYIEFPHDIGNLGDFHSVSLALLMVPINPVDLSDSNWFSIVPSHTHPVHAEFLLKHDLLKPKL